MCASLPHYSLSFSRPSRTFILASPPAAFHSPSTAASRAVVSRAVRVRSKSSWSRRPFSFDRGWSSIVKRSHRRLVSDRIHFSVCEAVVAHVSLQSTTTQTQRVPCRSSFRWSWSWSVVRLRLSSCMNRSCAHPVSSNRMCNLASPL